jgi:NAD(P)-dependent dehydrogenase (short-subunit alcohol dehydrogenase family)
MSRDSAAYNNVVLVTGSSPGFGRLIVTRLVQRGYTVFASLRDISNRNRKHVVESQELRRAEDLRLSIIELDVTDDRSVRPAMVCGSGFPQASRRSANNSPMTP